MRPSDLKAAFPRILLSLGLFGHLAIGASEAKWLAHCDVVWTSPSTDAAGSMPLGNGEVGINLWVEQNGDLKFYISRTDSLSEISRLLKVGVVRVALTPNPFVSGRPFHQKLSLQEGVCEIVAGEPGEEVRLRIFIDAESPVVHCVGESAAPVLVRASGGSWRVQRHTLAKGEEQNSAWTLHGAPFELIESADFFSPASKNCVLWFHRNPESVAVPATLELQSLKSAAPLVQDPLLHRTFGGCLVGKGFVGAGGQTLATAVPVRSFSLRVAVPCLQTTPEGWVSEARKIASKSSDAAAALRRTAAWWESFWKRSWVVVEGEGQLEIPTNSHPLRLGFDSQDQNRFPGALRQVAVFGRPLSEEEICALALAGPDADPHFPPGLLLSGNGGPGVLSANDIKTKEGLSLVAWIKPDSSSPGRIFDKLTAGAGDGFLFDTHPGNTLRLIVGNHALSAPAGSIQAGKWQHAVATVDTRSGALSIFLNGKPVASQSTERSLVTRGYTLQRYMQACGGRGRFPIKFNGGTFTVEPWAMGKPFNADWRAWGDCHWFQNVRHMYHPMLASGDVEMTEPMFRLYETVRPLCEARARIYHGAEGCYFPETMTVWGTYSNGDYGWDRRGHQPKDVLCPYWQYAWNQGPELVALMLDRWDYEQDAKFLTRHVLPMAESVLKYFDTRFHKTADGKIILDPTQAVETFWHGVTNDTPTVAGLIEVTTRLCALPDRLTTAGQRRFFRRMHETCPELPIEEAGAAGGNVRKIAPARDYAKKRSNCENPELYAVWPFRLAGPGKRWLSEARAAYAARANRLDVGWGYDGNCAALLGLTDEAARILRAKCSNSNPRYRWPATWGPNFDWLPDQNHGGNLLETAQLMLLQANGRELRLLPAWPRTWDVSFKLHAPQRTVVECVYRRGRIEKLEITPGSRAGDLILPEGLAAP